MMCEECGIRPATIHLTTISNGEKTERNLCAVCIAKYQRKLPNMDFSNLAGILSGLIGQKKEEQTGDLPDEGDIDLICPECGTTYAEFRKTGMLGCTHCYTEFREPLESLLTRVHGTAHHAGRMPGGAASGISIRISIDRLKQQLVKAIADEDYEDAAQLRDKIRALTQQMEAGSDKEARHDQ